MQSFTFGNSRLARGCEVQSERSRSSFESERFFPTGLGSRGVALGSDLPHIDWEKRIEHALATFESSPTILQRFHKGRLFEHSYWDPDSGDLKVMKGRVRLCPYYFVETDRVKLRG